MNTFAKTSLCWLQSKETAERWLEVWGTSVNAVQTEESCLVFMFSLETRGVLGNVYT